MTIDELEAELATRKGFAARVEAPGLLRNLAALLGIVGLLLVAGAVKSGSPALPVLVVCLASVLVVAVLAMLTERRSMRPLHQQYLARGWVSQQVPTGLVADNSGDGGGETVMRESVLVSGRRDRAETRIVLVGGAGQPAEAIEAAAAATRDELSGMTWHESFTFSQKVWALGYRRGGDAARAFPVPPGTLLTVETGRSPFVVVIPASTRSRRGRPRFYAVRTPKAASISTTP